MANRNKPLPAQVRTAQLADAALAQHLGWPKWPVRRQLAYLFAPTTAHDITARAEPHSLLAQLYRHCVALRSSEEQTRIGRFLRDLAGRHAALLTRPELAGALARVGLHYGHRVRELAAWQPRSRNPFHQLTSLLRHLFDRYGDVPAWVLHGWESDPAAHYGLDLAALAVHLGRGQALRSFAGLPVPVSKRLEHHLRQAPAGCAFLEAYRYAQLAERGAADWLGVALDSRLGREAPGPDDATWLALLDLFRAEPQVDPWQFGPVCDWIHFRRHIGSAEEPAQPGFSLRGRSLASLLAHAARWHRALGRLRRHPRYLQLLDGTWAGLPVADFAGGAGGWVRVRQLRSYDELLAEGRYQHHCVVSYARSCQLGHCGIFSLTFGGGRMLTLQLTPQRRLVQARGKYNRPPSAEERHWVQQWLREAQAIAADYVWDDD